MIEIKRKVFTPTITGGWPISIQKEGFYDVVLDYKSFVFSGGELKEVFRDGKLLVDHTLAEIRARINESLV